MKKQQSSGIFLLVLLVLMAIFFRTLLPSNGPKVDQIEFYQLLQKIEHGEIAKVTISGDTAVADAKPVFVPAENQAGASNGTALPKPGNANQSETLSEQAPQQQSAEKGLAKKNLNEKDIDRRVVQEKSDQEKAKALQIQYKVNLPEGNGVAIITPYLEKNDVPFTFSPPESNGYWMSLLGTLIVPIFIIILMVFIYRSAQSGGSQAMAFGKSKAKMQMDPKVKVTFDDVAGIDESKAELMEIVDFLKNGERYQKLGAKIPKGILLVGSPGTGKTLLAKAVAGEAGVPFFSISGSDFVEMFVGVGASRVRDLFEQAKKHAPCIIFVDEIDAVGRQRGAGMGGGHDEREQTLNQLLVEMDGFDPHTGIIVLAATNRPDILDNALLRPGRFDRQVMIDRPDVKGREEILRVHAKGKPLAEDVDLRILAKRTPGFTGADLSNLLNEGALTAARKNKDIINMDDIEGSIEKVLAGPEKKSRIISEKDKENTAYHEVGHALVGILTPGCDPVRKVSIIPRGMALGLTWTMPDDDKVSTTKNELLAQIAMLLGGRVAEETVYGEGNVTTGASNDLERVSAVARRIVTVFGMNDKLGPITYGKRNEHVFMGRDFGTERDYGEEVATLIDREVKELVNRQYGYVRQLLSDNRDMLEAMTKVLLEKETIDEDEVHGVIARVRKERGETAESCPVTTVDTGRQPVDIVAGGDEAGETVIIEPAPESINS
ncbi:MAG: ATP-dependent zinc metalloprotease FtsH [Vampirovibrionales bacterium]|nr:ATP-dependent zinc metalloprotease FtsH [Vampirovibrionales bacterium]